MHRADGPAPRAGAGSHRRPPPPDTAIARNHHAPTPAIAAATLRRGTRFLAAGLHGDDRPPAVARDRGQARVVGNGLREVDRFLSVLIDAVAARVAPPADGVTLHRLGNTARKLALFRGTMALASPEDAALRAIGRSRNCLCHTGGIVHAGRHGSAPTDGWSDPDRAGGGGAMLPPGTRIAVTRADLARLQLFYDRIADDLLAVAGCMADD